MTENEAINRLIDHFRIHDDGRPTPYLDDAVSIAMQALEKQIPKKPHKNFEKFSGVWCSCGKYLGKGYFVDKHSYCPDCGQAIDWSDTD